MKARLESVRDVEDELKVRFGKPKAGSAAARSWEFRSMSGSARAMMKRLGNRSRAASGGSAPSRSQRVVVKASYRDHRGNGHGLLRAHANYLARDSASLDGQEGKFYDVTHDEVDARKVLIDWQADPRHFRWIISPENAAGLERQPGGLQGYVRELMGRAERELGAKLQWLAINHYNTDDLHTHVLVRGVREGGGELRLPRQFVSHELRQGAQEVATRRLGPRSVEQVREARQQELTAERFTALDAVIQKHTDAHQRVTLPAGRGGELRQRAAARLQHLQQLGLAHRDRVGRWTVDGQVEARLRDLSERNDVTKNLYAKLGPRSAQVSRGLPQDKPLVGHVVSRGVHDELRDQMYLLVRDANSALRYARVVNGQNLSVLEEGAVVRLTGADPRRQAADQRIAQVALAHGGVYSAEAHRRMLPPQFAASDVDGFLASHQRRLKTLEEAGVATPTQAGWVIADPAALARGEHARFRQGMAFVEVLSARSVQSQIQAEAWTWLDRQRQPQAGSNRPAIQFDPTLQQAAEARQQWLSARGHPAAAELRQNEWQAAAPALQNRFGRSPQMLPACAQADGQYGGMVVLHSGLFAAIVAPTNVHLAPVTQAPPLAYGTPVRARVGSRGMAVLTRRAQQRQQELGLERD